ncbi:MAG: hypothetical protein JSU79_02095 [Dehalococcoidales bacterium]|nr:MAG: hypothetical protein JSU79_02095 [Dehalococcoidales bacterium]
MKHNRERVNGMDRNDRIRGMFTLLELNSDQFSYDMCSLAKKINNFFDDQSRLVSAQWLSVIYQSLAEENDNGIIEIITNNSIDNDIYKNNNNKGADEFNEVAFPESVEISTIKKAEREIIENFGIGAVDIPDKESLHVDDDRFAIVQL